MKGGRLIRVYSHPRSGTNFLMRFIAANFYAGQDLHSKPGRIGHWKNRIENQSNPVGKLSGTHHFFDYEKNQFIKPAVYLVRDGRAVAYSIWKTKVFQNPNWKSWCFSKFLREKLDWYGSPGNPHGFPGSIVEHWRDHVISWQERMDVLFIRYEDLVTTPERVRDDIVRFFNVPAMEELQTVDGLVGWYPNCGTIDAWQDEFSQDDIEYFDSIVPADFWGLWSGGGRNEVDNVVLE